MTYHAIFFNLLVAGFLPVTTSASALRILQTAPLLGSPAQAGAIQTMPDGERTFNVGVPHGATDGFTFTSWVRVVNLCTNKECRPVTSAFYSFGSATNALPRGYLRALDGLDWQQLSLTNATWGRASALTGTNGYWTLNVRTDSALTLTAAGNAISIAASTNRQEILIAALDASRDIAISAASSSAAVWLAVAEQPVLECFGRSNGVSTEELNVMDASSTISNEFVFVAQRISLAGGVHLYRSDMMHYDDAAPSGKISTWKMPANGLTAFAPDAFFQFGLVAAQLDASSYVEVWSARTYPAWLSNDELTAIRDSDLQEMQVRGINHWK